MNNVWKKPMLLLMLVAVFSLAISSSAFATGKGEHDKGKVKPTPSITVATAVTLIVNGLDLNIDNIRFIKEPKASDYYTKVKDDASYAKSFIIAQFNGLGLPKDINPAAKVTREQFAKWLFGALSTKGEYMWAQIYVDVADSKQVTEGYMDSIQKLLIGKIVSLDSNHKFYPKMNITLTQANNWTDKAAQFVKKMSQPVPSPESTILNDVKLTTEPFTTDTTKVTVSAWAPHAGYGVDIASIQFVKNEAIIHYRVVQPDPAALYAQVVTEVKAVAYIPSKYKAVLGPLEPSEPRA
jgi:hypothetical protein